MCENVYIYTTDGEYNGHYLTEQQIIELKEHLSKSWQLNPEEHNYCRVLKLTDYFDTIYYNPEKIIKIRFKGDRNNNVVTKQTNYIRF